MTLEDVRRYVLGAMSKVTSTPNSDLNDVTERDGRASSVDDGRHPASSELTVTHANASLGPVSNLFALNVRRNAAVVGASGAFLEGEVRFRRMFHVKPRTGPRLSLGCWRPSSTGAIAETASEDGRQSLWRNMARGCPRSGYVVRHCMFHVKLSVLPTEAVPRVPIAATPNCCVTQWVERRSPA